MPPVKINQLEIENVKRIKAVQLEPSENGLTVIGGNNNQGKTSVLDTIAWALGGDRYKPSNPIRDGSMVPPRIKLTLSNGLVVERTGKNSTLKVTDPSGLRSGQQLLNEFVDEMALNLPKFMAQSNREKADTLLRIIGIGHTLNQLQQQEKDLYNKRHTIGQIADQKAKYAKELPFYPDMPMEIISAYDLIQRQQAILARNGENYRKRQLVNKLQSIGAELCDRIERLYAELKSLEEQYRHNQEDLAIAMKSAEQLQDESTAELEQDIANVEKINIKVRSNMDREKAEQDATHYKMQYEALTNQLEEVRKQKRDLLSGAALPLEGLSVEDGELTYYGKKWDGMSASDQLRVSTAIVRSLNPQCGFVLVDKLEQFDIPTLNEFGAWAERNGLQVIATRVSTGSECSIIISDGYSSEPPPSEPPIQNSWKAGVF